MYQSPVPLLVIRAAEAALISVNGRMLGECPADGYVALPVSDTGEYYISAAPISGGYVRTRKVSFAQGELSFTPAPDLSVCVWPGGVYECTLHPAPAVRERGGRVLQSETYNGYALTLYREEGVKLGVERDGRPLYTYALGGTTGELRRVGEYMAALLEDGERERLILLDKAMQIALDVEGDAIQPESLASIERLGTLLGHERRVAYAPAATGFAPLPAEIGFFTHELRPPTDDYSLCVAFFEAVREGFEAEAMGYLTSELQSELTFAQIAAFLGPYTAVRAPFSDPSGHMMGLVEETGTPGSVRLYSVEFADGRIANIAEA